MPLHTRRRVIEAVLNEILGLYSKPKSAVHSVHKLTDPKKKNKKKKKEEEEKAVDMLVVPYSVRLLTLYGTTNTQTAGLN